MHAPLRLKNDYLNVLIDLASQRTRDRGSRIYEIELGLSIRDVRLLRMIGAEPGITMGQLVQTCGIEKTLVSKLVGSLGATPVGMPLPQIPDALSKGTINGCVIPWEVVPSVKVHELTKFHAEFDPAGGSLYTTTFVMTMNKNKYNGLPADLKKIIDEMYDAADPYE